MEQSRQYQDTDIVRTLGLESRDRGRERLKRWGIIAILGVLAVGVGIVVKYQVLSTSPAEFKTVKVQRGSLAVTVTATGTLKPINQVDMGSELSGTIETVEVDHNDRVKQGQILAMLNTDELKAKLQQSKAALESEQAKLQVARATVVETRLKFQRTEQLTTKGLLPAQDLDTAIAAYLRAQAEEASTKAQIALTRATLHADQTNLDKAAIHAPIDGIVLARKVEPGQTVAASFQTPVLFTLAEDLTRMVLHANIDEANMGPIKKGQDATFTVDAYPNRKFPAKITSIRNTPRRGEWEKHTPVELSGGQQQRVAIARAIVTNPAVLLADEPTGNLDSAHSREIMELLIQLNRDRGLTIMMVTHEPDMAAYAQRCVHFLDGAIAVDELQEAIA